MKTRFDWCGNPHAVTKIKSKLAGTRHSRSNNGTCGNINNKAHGVNVSSRFNE